MKHIITKQLKRLAPSMAYNNASASIILVFYSIWLMASPFHITPNAVNASFSHSMSTFSFGRFFPSHATTTSCMPRDKIASTDYFSFSACADTQNIPIAKLRTIHHLMCQQTAKYLRCNISFSFHRCKIANLTMRVQRKMRNIFERKVR